MERRCTTARVESLGEKAYLVIKRYSIVVVLGLVYYRILKS